MNTVTIEKQARPRIRFDRNELAGAFGDIGTDLPLVIGMIVAAGLDSASVLILFGLMQYFTAVRYGIPMAVQPLKAVAVIVITQQIAPEVVYGAGIAIGAVMLLLSITRAIDWLARVVPRCVVRGLQLGLGLQLALLALTDYIQADLVYGYLLAGTSFVIILLLMGSRRFPPALPVVLLGFLYAIFFHLDGPAIASGAGLSLPSFHAPAMADILVGFLVLALPQIPLSLGNSILATRQIAEDFYPERRITVRQLSLSYAFMNLIGPWFGGVPTCHGSGGLAGHHTFGARTGGSLIIYGSIFLLIGLFFAGSFEFVVQVFPLPILGVLLLFEGLALMLLVRDTAGKKSEFAIVLLVALLANGLPYGYVIALVAGTVLFYIRKDVMS